MNSPWVVGNGAHNRFRAMGNGGQIFWVTEVDLAMQFARRIDAENFAEGDEDAWQIIQIAALQEEQVDCGLEYAPGSDVAALAEVMEQKVADLHGRLQAMMEPFNAKESLERLKAEGFTTSSPEYLAAQLYFNQEPGKFEAEESLRRLKEWKLPCTNWELSNRLQEVELMDILQLLARQEITASKALEAIHSRVAGNEPALPEMGSGMEAQPDSSNSVQLVPEEQVKISPLEGELTARLVTAFEAKGAKVVLLQKDITLQELERVATSYETKGQPGTAPKINVKFEVIAGIATGTHYADVKRVEQEDDGSFTAVLATKAPYAFADCPDPSLEAATAPVTLSAERANPVHPLLHAWEPDFSEGEPTQDSKLCGLCGRTDDEYHVPRITKELESNTATDNLKTNPYEMEQKPLQCNYVSIGPELTGQPKQVAAMQPWTTNVVVESLAVVIREVMDKYVDYCRSDVGQLRAFFSAIENRNSGFCCDHIVVEDGNVDDSCVEFCIHRAKERRHLDCLATMLFIQAIKDEDTRSRVVNPDITMDDMEEDEDTRN